MTQYAYQPALADVNSAPADFTLTWNTGSGQWLVKDDGSGVACLRPPAFSGIYSALLWTGASGPGMVADCQIYLRVSKKVSANNAFGVARGQIGPWTNPISGYFAGMEWYGSSGYGQKIRKPPATAGGTTPVTLASFNSALRDYTKKTNILITVAGSTITVKTWDEGQNEATQSETATYASATEFAAAGYTGFTVWGGSSTAGSETSFYFIGVGTAGDAAPRNLPTPVANLALTDASDTSAVTGYAPVMANLALTSGGDISAILGRAPVNGQLALLEAADGASINGVAGSRVKAVCGITRERGALYASATGLRYFVWDASYTSIVRSGVGLSTDAAGNVSIDLTGTGHVAGGYAPVLITDYNAALAPADRVVRTMFGFVPVVAGP
jgi:hypothetical protein